ncbi:MAG TPA: RdgB/HAM1 family non-canonical purine NTP pyrophosphatase [Acidimicrobiia bacterium]|nr:RdgB/HAM1 family non-canonical purine NTP pyrophosphatase [Acidimicrobiia bacterium]
MSLPLPLVLATQNADKAREIVEIFVQQAAVPIAALEVQGVAYLIDTTERIAESAAALPQLAEAPDVEETGTTLDENARIKASALAEAFGLVAVADDTGLEVDGLDGRPGVYSARYAGEHATYQDNVDKLLRELGDNAVRTARFATCAMARWPAGREIAARGEVEGEIPTAARGTAGFGYDPVFVPREGDGRTFAEMTADEKHAVSHRGRAFRALAAALDETR